MVSLLKAWWGESAKAENDFCFDHLPRITGDHSTYPTTIGMLDGKVQGYFVMGENPAVGSANGKLQRLAPPPPDWLRPRANDEHEAAAVLDRAPRVTAPG